MKNYTVLYLYKDSAPLAPPMVWFCQADDSDHAEEQLLDSEPDLEIVWVVEDCDTYEDALRDWFNWADGEIEKRLKE